ncbi:type II toxin-antitoxin system RelE/ParE family toxin [Blautia obeum]|uniref:type II toxin-antitoxin system RelE/ParE family toxin n=2 Tax=Blautia obeum TaxID=40520 RepID=UPI00319E3D7A
MVAMKPYEGLSETGGESNFQKASKPSHEQKAVLTNGFIKKSQKTPKAEKELAKKYKADYERRYGNEKL